MSKVLLVAVLHRQIVARRSLIETLKLWTWFHKSQKCACGKQQLMIQGSRRPPADTRDIKACLTNEQLQRIESLLPKLPESTVAAAGVGLIAAA